MHAVEQKMGSCGRYLPAFSYE